MFAELAIPSSVDRLFTYSVPDDLLPAVRPGMRVVAPFGKRTVTGFVLRLSERSPVAKTRAILDVLDTEPVIAGDLLALAAWIADYYLAAPGDVIKAMLVQGAAKAGTRTVSLVSPSSDLPSADLTAAPRQAAIVRVLADAGPRTIPQLQKALGRKDLSAPLGELARKGVVRVEERPPFPSLRPKFEPVVVVDDGGRARWRAWLEEDGAARRAAKQRTIVEHILALPDGAVTVPELLRATGTALSSLRTLQAKGVVTPGRREVLRRHEYEPYASALGAPHIVLNAHQVRVLGALRDALDARAFRTFLLHGVTGSGKTQVYIEAIRDALARGKGAIVLVPEISLTPQIVRRFTHHFGEKVVTLHSRMSIGERYDAWRRTKAGDFSIVIGPRSAVFAPVRNLGLLIVDEEHEPSYKQFDQSPRYHARDVAIMRASAAGAVVVLGSATPSLESYTNALAGKHTLLELPERADNARLPAITIVDMTEERRRKLSAFREERLAEFKADREKARREKRRFDFSPVSDLLRDHIAERLRRREGVILLQNRRGYAPFVECPVCGHVEMCDNCNITLTFHRTHDHLRCHYCGLVRRAPEICPDCSSPEIAYRGVGTQRVEDELQRLFPEAVTLRMDLDTTSQRGAHDAMLRAFSEGEADILLGTQMVAKGLDFSRVTLVGVISADTQMLLPDFRSSERTFQLLTQVAGRAGRSALTGEVVIQTCQPRHETLRHVLGHDFPAFYKQEMSYREELAYPPFSRMALIEFRGASDEEVMRHADAFAKVLRERRGPLAVLGPAAAAIQKLKGTYRWHIAVKGIRASDPSGKRLRRLLAESIAVFGRTSLGRRPAVRMTLDIDPQGMM